MASLDFALRRSLRLGSWSIQPSFPSERTVRRFLSLITIGSRLAAHTDPPAGSNQYFNTESMKTLNGLFSGLILTLCIGLAPIAHADPLTSQQVERFIAAMPELTALGEKYQDTKQHNIDPTRPLSSSLAQMQGKGSEYTEFSKLAARHGFGSAEQFADVGDRIMQAYMFSSISMSPEEIEALYQQGVANVKKDNALNAEQKELILGRMAKSHQGNVETRKTVEQDLAALRPHKADLDKLFE